MSDSIDPKLYEMYLGCDLLSLENEEESTHLKGMTKACSENRLELAQWIQSNWNLSEAMVKKTLALSKCIEGGYTEMAYWLIKTYNYTSKDVIYTTLTLESLYTWLAIEKLIGCSDIQWILEDLAKMNFLEQSKYLINCHLRTSV